jgi:hypothetical protein
MRDAWTSFAATGTPSDAVVGSWSTVGRVGLGELEDVHDTVAHRTEIWLGEA